MPWLLLLLAAGVLAVAFMTTSMALVVACLLAALGLLLAGVMGLLAGRIGSRSRDEAMMIDPQQLRRLHEQTQAKRNAAQAGGGAPAS